MSFTGIVFNHQISNNFSMNTLTIAFFACLVVYASAGGIWGGHGGWAGAGAWGGHGVAVNVVPAGPTTLVGASGVVGPNGAAGPTGAVNGHGAVGPNGIPNAPGHGGILAGPGLVGAGLVGVGAWGGHDDGQWHGEGLLESQDLAGHGAGVIGLGHAGILGGHGLAGLGHW